MRLSLALCTADRSLRSRLIRPDTQPIVSRIKKVKAAASRKLEDFTFDISSRFAYFADSSSLA
jgi:hypothetical protein